MKKIAPLLMIVIVGLGVYFGFLQGQEAEVIAEPGQQPVPVEITAVTQGDLRREFTYSGIVEADYQVVISPNVGGSIQSITVKEGQKVTSGILLAKIDHEKLNTKLDTLEAKLETAEVDLAYWEDQYSKLEQLYQQGAIPDQQYSEVEHKYRLSQSSIKELTTNIAEVKVNITDFYIRAPRNAVISDIQAEQGSTAVPGQPLMTLIGDDAQKITISVSQNDLTYITVGTPVTAALGDRQLELEVTKIMPSLDWLW